MGWFGRWFGGGGTTTGGGVETGPPPIPSPFASGSPEFVDHVQRAFARVAQQFTSREGGWYVAPSTPLVEPTGGGLHTEGG